MTLAGILSAFKNKPTQSEADEAMAAWRLDRSTLIQIGYVPTPELMTAYLLGYGAAKATR